MAVRDLKTSLNSQLRLLDATAISETLKVLTRRIEERFPASGLGNISAELLAISEESVRRTAWIRKANLPLRGVIVAVLVVAPLLLLKALSLLRISDDVFRVDSFIQTAGALINSLVYLGVVVAFLFNLETRIKRAKAMKALHVLRSIAHIIDMHQLTKDPELVLIHAASTPSSPKRAMTAFELSRYLDYCIELLSLTSKIATLYIQQFADPVAVLVVDQIEDLTTGLSQKVWQKASLLNRQLIDDERDDRDAQNSIHGTAA